MKKSSIAMILGTALVISACGVLPFKAGITEGHSRVVNLSVSTGEVVEKVYLMCHRKRPREWVQSSQLEAGQHDVWVKANVADIDLGIKNAVVNFKVNLEAGKSYALNKERKGNKIAIWIEEGASSTVVSEIVVGDLRHPQVYPERELIRQCSLGTV